MHILSSALLYQLLGYFAQTEQFAFFDTSRPCAENRRSTLFIEPVARLQCPVQGDYRQFLGEVEKHLAQGYYVAGWFAYEFGYLLDRRLRGLTTEPCGAPATVADLGVYARPYHFHHDSGDNQLSGFRGNLPAEGGYRVENLHPNMGEHHYLAALERVKEYIAAGDTYQVNLTLKLLFDLMGSPEALYRDLRRNQSVAYGAYIRWGEERVMSFSPELFFRKERSVLTARPMKGTLRRGRTCLEDGERARFLQNDGKNRSENVMIVDLLRNDLGRVLHENGGGGEVRVRSLFDVETYESLFQMTSTILGIPEEGRSLETMPLATLFEGLFPCGSVTGAPKIRTMEIIAELERDRRGVYCGAIGYLAPDGTGVFNVPIRTIVLRGDRGEMGIGSGVTHGSDLRDEWRECLLKGRFLTDPEPEFELIETFFWSPVHGFLFCQDHLARLADSARYFSFFYDQLQILRRLEEGVDGRSTTGRVRLTLAKDGTVSVTVADCAEPGLLSLPREPAVPMAKLPTVRLSPVVMDSEERWRYHKTTRRQVYSEEYGRAVERGDFDVLFVNQRGELTEGAISNLVLRLGGVFLTPPRECGLLAGVMRGRLLAGSAPGVVERVLYPEDLLRAEAIYCCNAVRGVVPVSFSG